MKESALARDQSGRVEKAAGGAAEFAAIVNEHWSAVFRLLDTLTGNIHDTEDLTQETFLRALDRFASFRPGTNLRAWLLRIATNAFFDYRRKRKPLRFGLIPDVPEMRQPPPERRLEITEEGERLRAALAELTDLTRLVFHLRAAEELSFREIAQLAGTTEESARWHMCEARKKLLERLGEQA
jgi:RNA polymerase sigma factor (sigma-70 family)